MKAETEIEKWYSAAERLYTEHINLIHKHEQPLSGYVKHLGTRNKQVGVRQDKKESQQGIMQSGL